MIQPLKVVTHKKLAYLDSLSQAYKEMGYKTVLDGFESVLSIYDKSVNLDEIKPKAECKLDQLFVR